MMTEKQTRRARKKGIEADPVLSAKKPSEVEAPVVISYPAPPPAVISPTLPSPIGLSNMPNDKVLLQMIQRIGALSEIQPDHDREAAYFKLQKINELIQVLEPILADRLAWRVPASFPGFSGNIDSDLAGQSAREPE